MNYPQFVYTLLKFAAILSIFAVGAIAGKIYGIFAKRLNIFWKVELIIRIEKFKNELILMVLCLTMVFSMIRTSYFISVVEDKDRADLDWYLARDLSDTIFMSCLPVILLPLLKLVIPIVVQVFKLVLLKCKRKNTLMERKEFNSKFEPMPFDAGILQIDLVKLVVLFTIASIVIPAYFYFLFLYLAVYYILLKLALFKYRVF